MINQKALNNLYVAYLEQELAELKKSFGDSEEFEHIERIRLKEYEISHFRDEQEVDTYMTAEKAMENENDPFLIEDIRSDVLAQKNEDKAFEALNHLVIEPRKIALGIEQTTETPKTEVKKAVKEVEKEEIEGTTLDVSQIIKQPKVKEAEQAKISPAQQKEIDSFKNMYSKFYKKVAKDRNLDYVPGENPEKFHVFLKEKEGNKNEGTVVQIIADEKSIALNAKDKNNKKTIPSQEYFDDIARLAKQEGRPVSFGNMKDDEFKARLIVACLSAKPEPVRMFGMPKLDEEFYASIDKELADKIQSLLPKPKKVLENVKPTPKVEVKAPQPKKEQLLLPEKASPSKRELKEQELAAKSEQKGEQIIELGGKVEEAPKEISLEESIRNRMIELSSFTREKGEKNDYDVLYWNAQYELNTLQRAERVGLEDSIKKELIEDSLTRQEKGWIVRVSLPASETEAFNHIYGLEYPRAVFKNGDNITCLLAVGNYDEANRLENNMIRMARGNEKGVSKSFTRDIFDIYNRLNVTETQPFFDVVPPVSFPVVKETLKDFAKAEGVLSPSFDTNDAHEQYKFVALDAYVSHKMYSKHCGEFYYGSGDDKEDLDEMWDEIAGPEKEKWDATYEKYEEYFEKHLPKFIEIIKNMGGQEEAIAAEPTPITIEFEAPAVEPVQEEIQAVAEEPVIEKPAPLEFDKEEHKYWNDFYKNKLESNNDASIEDFQYKDINVESEASNPKHYGWELVLDMPIGNGSVKVEEFAKKHQLNYTRRLFENDRSDQKRDDKVSYYIDAGSYQDLEKLRKNLAKKLKNEKGIEFDEVFSELHSADRPLFEIKRTAALWESDVFEKAQEASVEVDTSDTYKLKALCAYADHKLCSKYCGDYYYGDEDSKASLDKMYNDLAGDERPQWDRFAEKYEEKLAADIPQGLENLKVLKDQDPIDFPKDNNFFNNAVKMFGGRK